LPPPKPKIIHEIKEAEKAPEDHDWNETPIF
jgi:hypothetical protein